MPKVEHFVAGFERRSFPSLLSYGTKREVCLLGWGPCLYLFLPFPLSDVFPAQMEGVKLVVNKVLSSHFQVLPLLWPLPACPQLLFLTPFTPVLARTLPVGLVA